MTALARPKPPRMTADEFIAWAMEQPEGERYELVAGEVVAMAPERVAHCACEGARRPRPRRRDRTRRPGVRSVHATAWPSRSRPTRCTSPTRMVRCGPPVPDDTVKMADPIIVVEVLSPSTGAHDAGAKLGGYFRMPSRPPLPAL